MKQNWSPQELAEQWMWHRFSKSRRAQPMDHTNPRIDELLIELYRASVV